MAEPKMCPICGTQNFAALSAEDCTYPAVRAKSNERLTMVLFCCEAGHLFMTLDEAEIEVETSRYLYDRHHLN